MRIAGVITLALLTVHSFSCRQQEFHDEEQMKWMTRVYEPMAATTENGGLRAIAVADSVMKALEFDLVSYKSVLYVDSTTYRVDYPYRDRDNTFFRMGGGITVFISRGGFSVLQYYLHQ